MAWTGLKQGQTVNSGVSNPTNQGSYQGLYDANPYSGASYTVSPWQSFLSFLGFRTEADAWRENMAVQANEYNAMIAQKQYDEEYNLPVNQVQRMKAAGLNPDISGGDGIEPGSAQNLGEDPSTPMQSSGTGSEQIMNFANSVMGIFSTALGLTGSIQGIARNRLENSLLSLQDDSAMTDFALKMMPFVLPQSEEMFSQDSSEAETWQNIAMKNAYLLAGNFDKKHQRKFLNIISDFFESAGGETLSYDELKSNIESRFGHRVAHSSYETEAGVVLKILADELGSMNQKIMKQSKYTELQSLEASEEEAKNQEQYFESLDASQQAGAENAQNKLSETNASAVQIMNESLGNIIDALKKKSDEGGFKGGLASVALALLSAFRLFITSQGMPSISRSSSSGGSSWFNGSGSASHSSQSISIGF